MSIHAARPRVAEGSIGADTVTGALPRSLMLERLQAAVHAAERDGGSLSVCLFDVDYFKSVNDAYGHERGDDVLRQVVERTAALVRAEDELFRYGGDEFVLLLPRASTGTARELARRVVEGVRHSPFPGEPALSLSISMGVASYPGDAGTVEELLRVADRRSFLAKRDGRARSVWEDRPEPVRTLQPVARLVERDEALARVHAVFADPPRPGEVAVLDVEGAPGSGRTRFLSEIATVARLRGYTVVELHGSDDAPVPPRPAVPAPAGGPGATGLCVTVDGAPGRRARAWLDRLLAGDGPPAVPVVVARTADSIGAGADSADRTAGDGAARTHVELAPWTAVGLRIWLRGVLRTEPDDGFVDRILSASQGLPARAETELQRLVEVGALVADPGGGWRVTEVSTGPADGILGRDREVAAVRGLLTVRRLVSVVGTGGVGKTTLARAAAAAAAGDFPGGTPLVRLETAHSRGAVEGALADALAVTPAPHQPLLAAVADRLRGARTLLVLDNFEQVLDAAPVVGELLEAVDSLVVLVTSRERLRLYGEQVFALEPLPLPDPDALPFGGARLVEAVSTSAAVRLFCARAREAAWDFSLTEGNARAVVDLCRRLDGLPLAIELAAARCGDERPEEVLRSLTRAVDVLVDGPRDRQGRQQTLRAAIDWSVGLLAPVERQVFGRLSVFPGVFGTQDALAVCGEGLDDDRVAAALAALLEKSLVRADDDRFTMLQVLREYSGELLEREGGRPAARRRHAERYAERVAEIMAGQRGGGQAGGLARVHAEYANLRAALAFAVETHDADLAGELAGRLWLYWSNRGLLDEGREWLQQTLALSRRAASDAASDAAASDVAARRGGLLNAAGAMATMQADLTAAGAHLDEALALARELEAEHPRLLPAVLSNRAEVHTSAGEYHLSVRLHEESLALRRAAGDQAGVAASVGNLGDCLRRTGELDRARDLLRESVDLNRRLASSVNLCIALANLGESLVLQGDAQQAAGALDEARGLAEELEDDDLVAQAENNLGMLAHLRGDPAGALPHLRRALSLRLALREQEYAAMSLDEIALVVAQEGDAALAVRAYAAAAALRRAATAQQAPVYRSRHEPVLAGLRELTGPRFSALWTAGASAPPDDFVLGA